MTIPPGTPAGSYRIACGYAQALDGAIGRYFRTSCADGVLTVTEGGLPAPTPTATISPTATVVPTRRARDGDGCAIVDPVAPPAWPAGLPLMLALLARRRRRPSDHSVARQLRDLVRR